MEAWLKNIIIALVLLLMIFLLLNFSLIYLTPFLVAILLAGLLNPPVNFLEEKIGLERSLAAFLVLFLFTALILFFIFIGLFQIYLELNKLLELLPDYTQILQDIELILLENMRILSGPLERILQENLELLYNTLKEGLLYLANNLLNVLAKLPLLLTVVILTLLATYFFTCDADKINDFILSLFPERYRGRIHRLEKEIINSGLKFLRAELILMSATGIITYLGFLLAGNDFALLTALTAAFLDIMPLLGPGLLFIPWILFNMVAGKFYAGLEILIIYTLVTAIRQGLEGKIMGLELGFHPLPGLIAFYIGYRLSGPLGFITGPGTLLLWKAVWNSGFFPNQIAFRE
ncbi:MAG: sporulation integral membrane protein YtvI [Halanaerobiales bacterium]